MPKLLGLQNNSLGSICTMYQQYYLLLAKLTWFVQIDKVIFNDFPKICFHFQFVETAGFRGNRYVKGGDRNVMLLYDNNGFIVGIQASVRKLLNVLSTCELRSLPNVAEYSWSYRGVGTGGNQPRGNQPRVGGEGGWGSVGGIDLEPQPINAPNMGIYCHSMMCTTSDV